METTGLGRDETGLACDPYMSGRSSTSAQDGQDGQGGQGPSHAGLKTESDHISQHRDFQDAKAGRDLEDPTHTSDQDPAYGPDDDKISALPQKRRKVNHACVYCRRSHMTCDLGRPCHRCIKRNIGHLCRDEPRDGDLTKSKCAGVESQAQSEGPRASVDRPPSISSHGPPGSFEESASGSVVNTSPSGLGRRQAQPAEPVLDTTVLVGDDALPFVQPPPVAAVPGNGALSNNNTNMNNQSEATSNARFHAHNNKVSNAASAANGLDVWLTSQNPYHDMHSYHPGAASEFSSEFNLLNEFLQSSLIDDGANPTDTSYGRLLAGTQSQFGLMPPGFGADGSGANAAEASVTATAASANSSLLAPRNTPRPTMLPQGSDVPSGAGAGAGAGARPGAALASADKAREYYLQAADPSGNDTPEARMQRVLKAKYDAGLLKPFNYIKGYSRLSSYLDGHVAPTSKQKILRQIDRFRPKFREKIQSLTDMDLVFVEMWFETSLMEYERVFASMAVPACCWRRTGEIFRGNKEMAELIDVPVERLRDGKIALHEILTEESVVRYWEEFGTIAFDPAHDTLLTACSVKSPDDKPNQPIVKCCFSFMIRRDDHKIPSLIVGHFVPHDP